MKTENITVAEVARVARDLDASAFQARFPDPALVISPRALEPEARSVDTPSGGTPSRVLPESLSETHTHNYVSPFGPIDEPATTPPRPPRSERDDLGASRVLFVRKSDRNPFAQMVTVGRAPNNDIIIADPAISKLHAYFLRSPSGWTLTDQKSSNGTYVDGVRIPAGAQPPLRDGAVIRLGTDVRATFLTPSSLHELVASYLRKAAE